MKKLQQFILNLDDVVVNTVTSQTLNMDPLSIVSNAYAMIVKEERHRIGMRKPSPLRLVQ